MPNIWIWQRMLSPHMAGLAASLKDNGCSVTFLVEEFISADRASQGWVIPDANGVEIKLINNKEIIKELVLNAPDDAIHICQGVRSNGLIEFVQKCLSNSDKKYWVIMETINDSGFTGVVKKYIYSKIFEKQKRSISGVLAIGYKTKNWLIGVGVNESKVYEFAYFMDAAVCADKVRNRNNNNFRFIFVGRLIKIKNIPLLIRALSTLNQYSYELLIVGDGPMKNYLAKFSEKLIPGRVKWIGQVSIDEVPSYIECADCLVLPSIHDGWGAVVSEALMIGTPVICSSACGSAGAVKLSPGGGVFTSNSFYELAKYLENAVNNGPATDMKRKIISNWATALNSNSGANYLLKIISSTNHKSINILPPWLEQVTK